MATFSYKALASDGRDVDGALEAADRGTAIRELAERGLSVTEIQAAEGAVRAWWQARTGGGTGVKLRTKQTAFLTRQLAVSLDAGLPLVTALEVMGAELDHAPSRELLRRLSERVQQGHNLSEALAEHPRTFPPMYVTLVRVGEASGALERVLDELADMLERQVDLRQRVQSASIYPAVLLTVGLISVVIIVTLIVPRIVESIATETVLLPWPTRVLMATSDLMSTHGLVLLALVAAALVGWRQFVLRGPGRPWWDATKLRIPLLARLIRQLEAARFARSMGILAAAGVTITEALSVVRDTLQNVKLRDAVQQLAESVRSGDSIARPLQRSGLFPPLLIQMIRVGENTGRLDEMLNRAAKVHESEARVILDRLVNVLPVLMILALACVIGFIVAGLVLAIVEFQTTGFGATGG